MGPGTKTRIGPDASPCVAYDSVTLLSRATVEATARTAKWYESRSGRTPLVRTRSPIACPSSRQRIARAVSLRSEEGNFLLSTALSAVGLLIRGSQVQILPGPLQN